MSSTETGGIKALKAPKRIIWPMRAGALGTLVAFEGLCYKAHTLGATTFFDEKIGFPWCAAVTFAQCFVVTPLLFIIFSPVLAF